MRDRWPNSATEQLADWIAQRTGLTFPASRREPVAAALGRAARSAGGSLGDLRFRLDRDPAALDALLADLTIGETYFFRHPEQLQLVDREIIPGLFARGRSRLRFWSAGCATGEEAYTLATLARDAGRASAVSILGTDLSRARLEVARRGRYRRWSLRGVSKEATERSFRETDGWFDLDPAIRAAVDFRYLNLVEDDYPAPATGVWGMDLVVCRNVLIYLDPPAVQLVAGKLLASLSEDGWLVLGASDPAISGLIDCEVTVTPAGLMYQRPKRRVLPPTPAPTPPPPAAQRDRSALPVSPRPAPERVARPAGAEAAPIPAGTPAPAATDAPAVGFDALRALYERRDYDAVLAGAIGASSAVEDARTAILLVRTLANQGKMAEAGLACATALERHRTSAELLYLHALLLLEAGRAPDAGEAARQALYLDRTLIVAHLALADATRRSGDTPGSRRALRNACDLLRKHTPTDVVPASDGAIAGRLLQMSEMSLELMREK